MPSVVLATGSYDRTIRLWDAPNGIAYKTIAVESQVTRVVVSPDKQYVAAAVGGVVQLFDTTTSSSNELWRIGAHKGSILTMGYNADGRFLYSGGEDGMIHIWDVRTRACTRSYSCAGAVNALDLLPDDVTLVAGDETGVLSMWDLRQCVAKDDPRVVPKGQEKVGLLASVIPEGPDVCVRSLNCSLDGKYLVTGMESGRCFVYDLVPGSTTPGDGLSKEPRSIRMHSRYILSTKFSPSGKLFATTSADGMVKIVDVSSLTPLRTLKGHEKWVWDCAWSNDSLYLVTASTDRFAILWDVNSGDIVRKYDGHTKGCISVALRDTEPPTSYSATSSSLLSIPSEEGGGGMHRTRTGSPSIMSSSSDDA
eukprot:TRINITY_DN81098_c0_g1_i1.p2 TRINITY_DN81098_c0_g1~~TRINITY_DN81098_c0_g1_i1.p2  ORF type:complete len:366 (-),score=80.83 TRINITY_DN81098_c0_g1_i1:1431-2528(-)